MNEKEIIKYFKSLGLEVYTSTKARGHQGFYMKNRIDVSKNVDKNRIIPTLLHEFAHYIHSKIEPFMERNGGTLEVIFNVSDVDIYKKELLDVTFFVDSHAKCEKLLNFKTSIKGKIVEYEKIIKNKYPKFMRSKKFKEFDRYIRGSKAKYLLKYDRVKLMSGFWHKKSEILTIDNLEKDFCDMPKEFVAYIRLKSCQKKQARVSARINKLKKYYEKPTELFARLVEGLYINSEEIQRIAPNTCYQFYKLLNYGYYLELKDVLDKIRD
jgi:hypothetical protein